MKTLIFVYNADSGFFNALTDSAHKLISPQSYDCQLCALTHSAWSMKKDWAAFLESLPVTTRFLHKNELDPAFPKTNLPAIFSEDSGKIILLANRDSIEACKSLEDLQELVTSSLSV